MEGTLCVRDRHHMGRCPCCFVSSPCVRYVVVQGVACYTLHTHSRTEQERTRRRGQVEAPGLRNVRTAREKVRVEMEEGTRARHGNSLYANERVFIPNSIHDTTQHAFLPREKPLEAKSPIVDNFLFLFFFFFFFFF